MSIEYERKLNDKFAEFCRFECGMRDKEEEIKIDIEIECEGHYIDLERKTGIDPCEHCNVREFIDYIRDDMEV